MCSASKEVKGEKESEARRAESFYQMRRGRLWQACFEFKGDAPFVPITSYDFAAFSQHDTHGTGEFCLYASSYG